MGIVICEKHGKQGIKINIENKIRNAMLEDKALKSSDFVVITVEFYDENEFLLMQKFLLFKETAEIEEVELYYKITNEIEEIQINKLNLLVSGICGRCYQEYINKNNLEIDF